MMNRLNIVLSVLLVVVVMLTVVMRPDPLRPNFEFLPDMKYSPAPLAYAPSSVFPNGRTLQAPVAGTIARGAMPLRYAATKEDAVRAGEELTNEYLEALAVEAALAATEESAETVVAELAATAETTAETTEEAADETNGEANVETAALAALAEAEPTAVEQLQASIQRGGERYRIYCITCHGPGGEGDGPVAKRGFPPPPSLLTGNSRLMKDGQLFHILTYGQGSMPQFAAQLSPADRWDIINYIRDIQPPIEQPVPSTEAPEAAIPAADATPEDTASDDTASKTDTAEAAPVE